MLLVGKSFSQDVVLFIGSLQILQEHGHVWQKFVPNIVLLTQIMIFGLTCRKAFTQIRKLFAQIPEDFHQLKFIPAKNVPHISPLETHVEGS